MKAKTKIKQKSKTNNLKLIHIAALTDAEVNPYDFEYIKTTPYEFVFKHKTTGKLLYIRR